MKYRAQQKVSKRWIEIAPKDILIDDYCYKELIYKMIEEIPLDELKKVFALTKLDPDEKIKPLDMPLDFDSRNNLFQKMNELKRDNVILYEAEININ